MSTASKSNRTTHTPGPWRPVTKMPVSEITDALGEICVEHPTFDALEVFMPRWAKSFEEHRTNAHLIAAAPQLLAALKSIVDYNDGSGYDDYRLLASHMRLARKVIAKAEGR